MSLKGYAVPISLFLIDTSVWLEVLPTGKRESLLAKRVDELLATDAVATTGMVKLELLGGARSETEYRELIELFGALHLLPQDHDRWDEAASMAFRLRRVGVIVPFTDLLIAATAIGDEAVLLHCDRHFDLVASHSPLKVESRVGT